MLLPFFFGFAFLTSFCFSYPTFPVSISRFLSLTSAITSVHAVAFFAPFFCGSAPWVLILMRRIMSDNECWNKTEPASKAGSMKGEEKLKDGQNYRRTNDRVQENNKQSEGKTGGWRSSHAAKEISEEEKKDECLTLLNQCNSFIQ